MGDTDYDRGWNAGYNGFDNEPPAGIVDTESWKNGYSDGVSQFNIDQDDYYSYDDEAIDWLW